VLLSGSGPTHLLLFDDVERARGAAAELTEADIAHWLAPAPVAGCHVVDLL
jgi:4-diphosphocytidyl-2C-methyl-D-erythritol kinase